MRKGDNLEKLFPEPCNKTFLSLNPPPFNDNFPRCFEVASQRSARKYQNPRLDTEVRTTVHAEARPVHGKVCTPSRKYIVKT